MRNCRFSGAFVLALTLGGCTSFPIPKEYVPDSQVVYLIQNLSYGPIAHPAVPADPYTFSPDLSPVNSERPGFLTATWESLLKADFKADSRLYREVEAHLGSIWDLPGFQNLRTRFEQTPFLAPEGLRPDRGDKLKDYSNGGLYAYPEMEGAQITILDGGYFQIDFPGQGYYRQQPDGTFERVDGKGKVVFSARSSGSSFVFSQDGYTFSSHAGQRSVEGPEGTLAYLSAPIPQFQFSPAGAAGTQYTVFLDSANQPLGTAMHLKNGLRYDSFTDRVPDQEKGVLITNKDQALFIDERYQKVHQKFDPVQRKATDVLSLYFPEGLRMTNFTGTGPAYAELRPAWPVPYKSRVLGPFEIYYTAQDEALVGKLRADRLNALESADRKQTGLSAQARRSVIIPPDLETYRKMAVSQPGETLLWYPSGFEIKDYIVMWPISVPRYTSSAGQAYFFEQEFYQILTHEYVHILVGENSGLGSPVPVWLNEGLAVYVESLTSPEVRSYWDLTFWVSQGLGRLLDWDLATVTGTGELPVARARVHYAQSYALVRALVEKFGVAKVAAYVRSFRGQPFQTSQTDLKVVYRTKFKETFGQAFDKTLLDSLLNKKP